MKTYLFDTINRYKRYSEELDAKTILCNKSWKVFNDSGEKELYIFNVDGTLIISVSGKVTNASWQYISANKSIVISGNTQSYMVRPIFYDRTLFVLRIDGTSKCAFLIDENSSSSINLKSLSDLKNYFEKKENKTVVDEHKTRLIEKRKQEEVTALKQQNQCEKRNYMNQESVTIKVEKRSMFTLTQLWIILFIGFALAIFSIVLLAIFAINSLFYSNTNITWLIITILSSLTSWEIIKYLYSDY